MTTDPLDALLDASAPAPQRLDAVDARAMIAESRAHARPTRRVRRRALLGGALALFLVGGAGIATASGDWLWTAGLDNPDRVYTYTSPTWGQCELRFSALDTKNIFTNVPVNRIVDDWYARTDVEEAAAPLVPKYLREFEDAVKAEPGAEVDPRRADQIAWMAHGQAVGELVHAELEANGFGNGALAGATSHSQVHCDAEDWGGE